MSYSSLDSVFMLCMVCSAMSFASSRLYCWSFITSCGVVWFAWASLFICVWILFLIASFRSRRIYFWICSIEGSTVFLPIICGFIFVGPHYTI